MLYDVIFHKYNLYDITLVIFNISVTTARKVRQTLYGVSSICALLRFAVYMTVIHIGGISADNYLSLFFNLYYL